MTGLRRTMGLVFALAAFQAPLWAANLDEVTDTFKQGVEQWQRGHEKEALDLFKKVLASSPSQESAYALWTDPEIGYAVWRELLTSGGDAELVAKRLIDLARVERKARANNEDAIKALVAEATGSEDPVARRNAIQKLSADHGEYAAAFLVGFLGSGMSDQDKTVRAMDTLVRMNTDVVVPLCTALASEDAVQRRNLCYVLGTIGDKRAAGYLAWHAAHDADGSVQAAAKDALQRAKWGDVDACRAFLASGDAYHHRQMRDEEFSDVVWSWTGGKLASMPIPRAIYNDELAKTAYDHALTADPKSVEALAGLARSYVAEASSSNCSRRPGRTSAPGSRRSTKRASRCTPRACRRSTSRSRGPSRPATAAPARRSAACWARSARNRAPVSTPRSRARRARCARRPPSRWRRSDCVRAPRRTRSTSACSARPSAATSSASRS